VDETTAIGSVLAAFGLSGAAGLNAWLPLLVSALAVRWGLVELGPPFGDLSSTAGIVVLAVLTAADFVGDKIPAVDHVLHVIGGVVHPVAGALLFTGQTGLETDIPDIVSIVIGAVVAGSVHGARATIRPASTVGTAGTGNPVLSLSEDAGSAVLTVAAFVVPLLAFLLVVAVIVLMIVAWRRTRRLLRGSGGRPELRH
jgi:Domain of unknown function (DUF4126)